MHVVLVALGRLVKLRPPGCSRACPWLVCERRKGITLALEIGKPHAALAGPACPRAPPSNARLHGAMDGALLDGMRQFVGKQRLPGRRVRIVLAGAEVNVGPYAKARLHAGSGRADSPPVWMRTPPKSAPNLASKPLRSEGGMGEPLPRAACTLCSKPASVSKEPHPGAEGWTWPAGNPLRLHPPPAAADDPRRRPANRHGRRGAEAWPARPAVCRDRLPAAPAA